MKDTIQVQTQHKEDKQVKHSKKITSKHWKIYYQLMSLSKYNSKQVEDHRYVYKNAINISQLCRENDIKSNKTFYNAIERLSEWGLVEDFSEYFLLYAPNWVEISPHVLKTLLAHVGGGSQHIDLLRIYLILKKMDKLAQSNQDRSFTAKAIIKLLDHGTSNSCSYENVRFYLAILSYWGLIELKVHREYDPNIGSYKIYHLQKVNETNLSEDFEIDDKEAEAAAPLLSEEMMEKLKFVFPNIIEKNE